MKGRYPKLLMILVAIVTILICYITLNEPIFMDSQAIRYPSVLLEDFSETGYYEIDPETILESLESSERDVFAPLKATPDAPIYSTSFLWKQADYLTIANSLQEFVWKETPANWNIHSMSFYGDCVYNPIGFDIAHITYYKESGLQRYDARMIGIYPLIRMVAWGAGENYPRSLFEKKEYINSGELTVTAEKAIQLADENGGRESRLAVGNACRISASISSNTQNWTVVYTDKTTYSIFEMTIDPYTAAFEILKSSR